MHSSGNPNQGAQDGDTVSFGGGNGGNSGDVHVYTDNVWTQSDDHDIDDDGLGNGRDPDMDGDGIPNNRDDDMDGDGIDNQFDSSPFNPYQGGTNGGNGHGYVDLDFDTDGDGIPDNRDDDMDGDGIPNVDDNDTDGDGIGNSEDEDDDNDGIKDSEDDSPRGSGSIFECGDAPCSCRPRPAWCDNGIGVNIDVDHIFNIVLFDNIEDILENVSDFRHMNTVIPFSVLQPLNQGVNNLQVPQLANPVNNTQPVPNMPNTQINNRVPQQLQNINVNNPINNRRNQGM